MKNTKSEASAKSYERNTEPGTIKAARDWEIFLNAGGDAEEQELRRRIQDEELDYQTNFDDKDAIKVKELKVENLPNNGQGLDLLKTIRTLIEIERTTGRTTATDKEIHKVALTLGLATGDTGLDLQHNCTILSQWTFLRRLPKRLAGSKNQVGRRCKVPYDIYKEWHAEEVERQALKMSTTAHALQAVTLCRVRAAYKAFNKAIARCCEDSENLTDEDRAHELFNCYGMLKCAIESPVDDADLEAFRKKGAIPSDYLSDMNLFDDACKHGLIQFVRPSKKNEE